MKKCKMFVSRDVILHVRADPITMILHVRADPITMRRQGREESRPYWEMLLQESGDSF
ncbi:MAG: hypothetical protein HDS84_03010 [Bacteroidales bacterium]|nr:hypothetical protein [Bacteroidales bacterium]